MRNPKALARKKTLGRELARERCLGLLALAKKNFSSSPALSRRYVSLARKTAMRHRIRLGRKLFCRKCNSIFIHAKTLRVRANAKKGIVLYTCLACKNALRFQYGGRKRPK